LSLLNLRLSFTNFKYVRILGLTIFFFSHFVFSLIYIYINKIFSKCTRVYLHENSNRIRRQMTSFRVTCFAVENDVSLLFISFYTPKTSIIMLSTVGSYIKRSSYRRKLAFSHRAPSKPAQFRVVKKKHATSHYPQMLEGVLTSIWTNSTVDTFLGVEFAPFTEKQSYLDLYLMFFIIVFFLAIQVLLLLKYANLYDSFRFLLVWYFKYELILYPWTTARCNACCWSTQPIHLRGVYCTTKSPAVFLTDTCP